MSCTYSSEQIEKAIAFHGHSCPGLAIGIRASELEEMFIIGEPVIAMPHGARIMASQPCEACGEMTMESRTRRFDGRTLCIPCFGQVEQKI